MNERGDETVSRCVAAAEFASLSVLPVGAPERRHLDACPRCQGMALAYAEFMNPTGDDGFALREADDELRRRLAAAFDRATDPAPRRWRPTWPRLAWATSAAVLVVAAVGLLVSDLERLSHRHLPEGTGIVRGQEQEVGLTAQHGPAGLQLSWPAEAGSDRSLVLFYDEELEPLGRRVVDGEQFTVDPDDPLVTAAFCQLLRLAGEDTLSRGAIVAPRPFAE